MTSALHSVVQVVLAHHSEKDLDRCFPVGIQGQRFHVCARCSGVCIGGLIYFALPFKISQPLLFILACLAVCDCILFAWDKWNGNNSVRFLSGCLLGLVQIENLRAYKTGALSPFLIIADFVCCAAFLAIILRRVRWPMPVRFRHGAGKA